MCEDVSTFMGRTLILECMLEDYVTQTCLEVSDTGKCPSVHKPFYENLA